MNECESPPANDRRAISSRQSSQDKSNKKDGKAKKLKIKGKMNEDIEDILLNNKSPLKKSTVTAIPTIKQRNNIVSIINK